ncbi:MAG TPA: hypothetical protein VMT32_14880 [Bryobacteraceae bacterium]|nr:hypothetical protein [Bryobacteraceae bacterium]
MACPLFEPVRHRADGGTLLPLRDFWFGVCHADEGAFEPDERLLSECCNMGYARGKCARFPQAGGPDAVRFAIARDSDQKIFVSFAIETDHRPCSHGSLEFSRPEGKSADAESGSLLGKQAAAYVASYLRRRPASN